MVSEAKRRGNNKWDRENMAVMSCKMRKDKVEEFKRICKEIGTSPNEVFRLAVERTVQDYEKRAEGRQEAADKAAGEAGVLGMILGAEEGKTE